MEIEVTPKKWYVVSGATGSTVSKPDGIIVATVPAGGQTAFLATTHMVVTSNNRVEVVQATFNGAPIALGFGGGGNSAPDSDVPSTYIPALFLENTGSQYIDTKLQTYSDSVISTTVQQVYASDILVSGFNWFFGSVQNPGMNIGFSVTEYRYSSILGYVVIGNKGGNMRDFADAHCDVLHITNTANHFIINGETVIPELVEPHAPTPDSEITYPIFGYVGSSSGSVGINKGCRIFSFSDTTPSQGGKRLDLVPAIDSNGAPCMWDRVTRQTYRNAGDDSFIVGLTVEQAKQLWKLPVYAEKKTLTISLPSEAVDGNGVLQDVEIFMALSQAAAKGWNFILQTHDGTAVETAVPFGYMQCEFLESTGSQHIDTGIALSNESELRVVTRATTYPSVGFSYVCGGVNSAAASLLYYTLLFPDSVYLGLGSTQKAVTCNTFTQTAVSISGLSNIGTVNGETIEFTNVDIFTQPFTCPLFAQKRGDAADVWAAGFPSAVYSFSISRSGSEQLNYTPSITPGGVPCMYDSVSGEAKLNADTAEGAPDFVVGMTAAQAVQLANLPEDATDKNITVSLPQSILNAEGGITDAAVNAALNKAAENGWDIKLQYYTES